MEFLQVLGLISGIMGFWPFGDNMFPQQTDNQHSNYKVFIGVDGTANPGDPGECCLTDAGGDIYYSKVFNSYGLEIGRGGQFPKLKSGSDEVCPSKSSLFEKPELLLGTSRCFRLLTMRTIDHHHVAEYTSTGGHC